MSYDGHGRIAARHYPIEDTSANTTWTYNADNSIDAVTDPRGVVTDFTYNSTTGLMTGIAYTVPGTLSNVNDTPDVSFSYDNLGNRTGMTDGTGSTSYTYNSLSQMTSETKSFTGLSGSFTLNYTYNLSGGVHTVSDPQNSNQLGTYVFDKVGRVTGASQTSSSNNLQSVHDAKFRAWDVLKEYKATVGSSTTPQFTNFQYDLRLEVSGFERGIGTTTTEETVFQRYADGSVKRAEDTNNPTFDRRFRYDDVGRIIQGQSGFEANGRTDVYVETPYRNNISYNAFNEPTGITGKHWPQTIPSFSPTIDASSGRISTSAYDASGNITSERIESIPDVINRTMKYEASGRNVETYDPSIHSCCGNVTYRYSYDGDGSQVKAVNINTPSSGDPNTGTDYEIRSTVLGGETVGRLKTVDWSSNVQHEFILPVNGLKLNYNSALGANMDWTAPEGIKSYGREAAEFDTMGSNVGTENPYNTGEGGAGYPTGGGDPTTYTRCSWEGMPASCGIVFKIAFTMNHSIKNKGSDPPGLPTGVDSKPPQIPVPGQVPNGNGGDNKALALTAVIKPVDSRVQSGQLPASSVPDGCAPQHPDGSYTCSVEVRMPPVIVRPDPMLPRISTQVSQRPPKDCEFLLAYKFMRTPGNYFADVTDGDPTDPLAGSSGLSDLTTKAGVNYLATHNHGYNPEGDLFRETPVYAPPGGVILGGLANHNTTKDDPIGQTAVSVFYSSIGGESDIVLQFYHVENYAGRRMADGSLYLGTMGKNGMYLYRYIPGREQYKKIEGYHLHINAWKWWGPPLKKGDTPPNRDPGAPPYSFRQMKNIFRLSKLC